MTVRKQGQYNALDDQVGSSIFVTNFYGSESSVFGI